MQKVALKKCTIHVLKNHVTIVNSSEYSTVTNDSSKDTTTTKQGFEAEVNIHWYRLHSTRLLILIGMGPVSEVCNNL